jgi:UDP-N-acetylmuramoyl-tripeptide--D-alanyl-D-alanine ligase
VVTRAPLAGEHNARNAAAALAVALALGRPAREAAIAMERVELPAHRSHIVELGGLVVMDDCYNANPGSMSAALETVARSVGSARGFAVLGDMLELGREGPQLHREIGAQVSGLGYAGLVTVGELAGEIAEGARAAGLRPDRVFSTEDPAVAAATVRGWAQPGDWVLVKASRGLQLERVIAALER